MTNKSKVIIDLYGEEGLFSGQFNSNNGYCMPVKIEGGNSYNPTSPKFYEEYSSHESVWNPFRNQHGDIMNMLNFAYNYFLVNLPLFWFASIFATIFEMFLIEVKKIVKPIQFISIFFIFSIFTYLYFFPSFLFFIFFVPVAIYNAGILYPIIKALRKKKIKLKI